MYITGEITTATFALIENTKTNEYKDKRKGPTYTPNIEDAQQFPVNAELFDKISWMTELNHFVIHFCDQSTDEINGNRQQIHTTGQALRQMFQSLNPTLTTKQQLQQIGGVIEPKPEPTPEPVKVSPFRKKSYYKHPTRDEWNQYVTEQQERKKKETIYLQEQYAVAEQLHEQMLQTARNLHIEHDKPHPNQPLMQLGIFQTKTIGECLYAYFDTHFYDIIAEHISYYTHDVCFPDVCVAQTTTLDLTTLPTTVVVNGVTRMMTDLIKTMWLQPHQKLNRQELLANNQRYLFKYKPSFSLQTSEKGVFFVIELIPHRWNMLAPKPFENKFDIQKYNKYSSIFNEDPTEYLQTIPHKFKMLTIKKNVLACVNQWKQQHKTTIESIKHRESDWWDVTRAPFVNPTPNTNMVYIAYLPTQDIIKVGRTQNWESRENTYRRIQGPTPETTGNMRLCYAYETPVTGDKALDTWLLYCTEDHLKHFANQRMSLVAGNEFFRGLPVQELCIQFDEYIRNLSIHDLLSIRSMQQAKQFALNNHYDADRFLLALSQLATKNP